MDFKKLTEYLDSLVDEKGIPSVDCIVCREHEEIYRHFYGTVDEARTKKVSENQLYLVFSMTKIQTMTAIMQLVEKGLISLEDEVGDYLPAYKNLLVKEKDGSIVPAKTPLKIKYLISMQSGLDYNLERGQIKNVLKEKGDAASTEELVNAFVKSPLDFHPGTHFQYSLSHDVAAALVEKVSKMSFSQYLKKNIWEPLGMKDTFFAKPENDDIERLATQYIMNDEGIVLLGQTCNYQLSKSYESGGAGLISSTYDYSLLADALANGGTGRNKAVILAPATVETIKTNLLCEEALEDIERTMGRKGYGYGCGMQILMDPKKAGASAPVGVFGWDGAAGSCTIMDTASKTSLVFTMHVRNCGPAYGEYHPALRDIVFGK